jgi:hypothetical protein
MYRRTLGLYESHENSNTRHTSFFRLHLSAPVRPAKAYRAKWRRSAAPVSEPCM